MRNYATIFLAFFILACNEKRAADEGFIQVEGGKVWYKIVGADKKKTPLLLLHAGPGASSYYLTPLERLATDRPVIFYDQLGCGRSDRPDDTSLWRIKRFAKEIETVKKELGLNKFHLLGHSIGTSLALEYMATRPEGVKSLILVGPILNTKKYLEDGHKLKLQLPSTIRDTLLFHEEKGTMQSKSYQDAYLEYLKTHFCRIFPFPKEIEENQKYAGAQVYETMWGGNEFFCTANLKDFDRTSVLKEMGQPILFASGQYDFCTPETTKWFARQAKNANVVVFEKSAHLPMLEEPDTFLRVVKQFLDKHE